MGIEGACEMHAVPVSGEGLWEGSEAYDRAASGWYYRHSAGLMFDDFTPVQYPANNLHAEWKTTTLNSTISMIMF